MTVFGSESEVAVSDRELSDSFPFHSEKQGGQEDIPKEHA